MKKKKIFCQKIISKFKFLIQIMPLITMKIKMISLKNIFVKSVKFSSLLEWNIVTNVKNALGNLTIIAFE